MEALEATPQAANAAPPAPSLRRPTQQWLTATGILMFSMLLVIQDLAKANRPHELHNAPWVAGITLLNLVLCAWVLVGLVRYARARPGRSERGLGFYALALGLAVVATLDVLIFAGAAGTVPAVLAG